MALQESTKKTIQDLRASLSILDNEVTDLKETEGRARIAAIKSSVDALKTSLDGTDFQDLT